VNRIVRLPRQLLAAMDAAGLAAGVRPDEAGSTIASRGSQAEFNCHIAGLERQGAKSNLSEGNSRDFAASLLQFAQWDLSPAAERGAETKPESAALTLTSPLNHKPGKPTAPRSAQIRSGPGSMIPAARTEMFSAGGIPPPLGEVNSRAGSLRGYLLGAAAAMPTVNGFIPGIETPSRDLHSLDSFQALSFHDNKAPEAVCRPTRPHDFCASATLPPNFAPVLPGNSDSPQSSATAGNFRVGGDQNGKLLQRSEPELLYAARQDGNHLLTVAAAHPPTTENGRLHRSHARSLDPVPAQFWAAESGDLNAIVSGTFDLEERAASPDWNRTPDIAALAPVAIKSLKQETHLALAKAAALSSNFIRAPQFPSRSIAAGERAISTAPAEAQIPPANLDYEARDAQTQGDPLAEMAITKEDPQDYGAHRPVNFQALAVNERDDPVSANLRSPASNVPSISRASVFGDSGVEEGNPPQPPPQGAGSCRAWPPPNDDTYISVTQRGRRDSQLIAATRTAELAVIEKADVSPSKSISLARGMPFLSQLSLRSNLPGSSTGAGLRTASQSSNAPGAQPHGSYPGAIVTEPKGARSTDEISPTPISTFAVSQPLHPGSATMLSPAVQIALCVIGASDIGGTGRESMLAQSQPTVHLAAEAALLLRRFYICSSNLKTLAKSSSKCVFQDRNSNFKLMRNGRRRCTL
jgi:hypothetical protein